MSSDANGKIHSDWEKTYVDQLSYSINLFFVTATGALGFCISQLINKSNNDYRFAFQIAVVCLLFSMFVGALCTIIRLLLFGLRKPLTEENTVWHFIFGIILLTDINRAKWERKLEGGVFVTFVLQIIVFLIGISPVGLQVVFSS